MSPVHLPHSEVKRKATPFLVQTVWGFSLRLPASDCAPALSYAFMYPDLTVASDPTAGERERAVAVSGHPQVYSRQVRLPQSTPTPFPHPNTIPRIHTGLPQLLPVVLPTLLVPHDVDSPAFAAFSSGALSPALLFRPLDLSPSRMQSALDRCAAGV
eukprot:1147823-Rhodomonas_salina.1